MSQIPRTSEDLTARARIRDAALEVYAEHGEKGATVRGIADRAGVSPALVQHHFGNKRQLRAACDEYIAGYFSDQVRMGIDEHGIEEAGYAEQLFASSPAVLQYLSRALVDGSPGSADIFDRLVDLTVRYLERGEGEADPRDRSVVLVAMRLGLMVLHQHVNRSLETDLFTSQGASRVGRALLDVLNPHLADPELMASAARSIEQPTAPASVRRSGEREESR